VATRTHTYKRTRIHTHLFHADEGGRHSNGRFDLVLGVRETRNAVGALCVFLFVEEEEERKKNKYSCCWCLVVVLCRFFFFFFNAEYWMDVIQNSFYDVHGYIYFILF
jgi:hypothetical protein